MSVLQRLVKNSCTEFHANPTDALVADVMSHAVERRTEGGGLHVRRSYLNPSRMPNNGAITARPFLSS